MAVRFDKTRVFFAPGGQSAEFELKEADKKELRLVGEPVAKFGPGPVSAADAEFVKGHGELFGGAHAGEEWELEVSAGLRIRVVVKEPVVGEAGCFEVAGFLAEAIPEHQSDLSASPKRYFLIHKPSSGAGRKRARVGELPGWKATPELRLEVERMLQARVKDDVAKVHAAAVPGYERGPKRWAERWKQVDARLARGEGKLSYDMRAFRLTPDGAPRVFVRAQWTIDWKPVFFMSAWLRVQSGLAIEAVESRESGALRMIEWRDSTHHLDFLGAVLNVFDGNGDGHGEMLMYHYGYEGGNIELYRYTDAGPVRTEVSLGWGC